MDPQPSCAVAASLFGLALGHPFVFLGRMLQETCLKIGDATDSEVLLAVTVTRVGSSGGVLLFGSGYVDGEESKVEPLPHADALISVAVDSLAHALRQVDVERRLASGPPRPEPPKLPPPSDLERSLDQLRLGSSRAGPGKRTGDEGAALQPNGVAGDHASDGNEDEGLEWLADSAPSRLRSDGVDDEVGRAPADPLTGGAEHGGVAGDAEALPLDPSRPGPADGMLDDGTDAANACDKQGGDGDTEASKRHDGTSGAQSAPSDSGRPTAGLPVPSAYMLPDEFMLPGLISAPTRIRLLRGRGRTRTAPLPGKIRSVTVAALLVEETLRELMPTPAFKSLLLQLVPFSKLCKFVIDTLVERQLADPNKREAVNHSFL